MTEVKAYNIDDTDPQQKPVLVQIDYPDDLHDYEYDCPDEQTRSFVGVLNANRTLKLHFSEIRLVLRTGVLYYRIFNPDDEHSVGQFCRHESDLDMNKGEVCFRPICFVSARMGTDPSHEQNFIKLGYKIDAYDETTRAEFNEINRCCRSSHPRHEPRMVLARGPNNRYKICGWPPDLPADDFEEKLRAVQAAVQLNTACSHTQ